MCNHESDDENKEQETTYDKPLSDDVSKPRAGQFSNNLHTYVNNIIKVVSNTTLQLLYIYTRLKKKKH